MGMPLLMNIPHMSENMITVCMRRFMKHVVDIFKIDYLRAPNADDTTRPMEVGAARWFPGILMSTCTGGGRIVPLDGLGSTPAIAMI